MLLNRYRRNAGRIILLAAALLLIGLSASGCVSGLTPVGWSGGEISGGTLFVGSKEGRLVAISLADDSKKQSEPFKVASSSGFGCLPSAGGGCATAAAGVAIYGTPAVSGNLVYLGGYNGKFYSFDSNSLQISDIYPPDVNLSPIIGGSVVGGGKVFFGDSKGKVYALEASRLIKQAEFQTGDQIWATPALSGDTLYIGSFDKKLYALSTQNLAQKWAYPTGGAIIGTPVVNANTVYFGSLDRQFYALNAADGTLKWKFAGGNWFWSKPVLYKNTIYAGCLDGKVYALQADTGAKLAEFILDGQASSSPVMVNESVIFASRKGTIYSINTATNQMRELTNVGSEVSGALSAGGEIVYIHTANLVVHRINAVSGAVLPSLSLSSKG